jgi:hypothetical protein
MLASMNGWRSGRNYPRRPLNDELAALALSRLLRQLQPRTGGRVRSKARHWKCRTAARLSWVQIPTRPPTAQRCSEGTAISLRLSGGR